MCTRRRFLTSLDKNTERNVEPKVATKKRTKPKFNPPAAPPTTDPGLTSHAHSSGRPLSVTGLASGPGRRVEGGRERGRGRGSRPRAGLQTAPP